MRRAAREPRTLFIALDADVRAMIDTSRRAARSSNRGGRRNVMFIAAAVEMLPDALRAFADEVTVVLPWGSLLDAVLRPETDTFAGIAAVLRDWGVLTILVSAQTRDHVAAELDTAAAQTLAGRYAARGFADAKGRPATRDDVERLSSGWGRKLGIPERRSAWLFDLRKCAGEDAC